MEINYWHIVILFSAWAVVATTLTVVLLWHKTDHREIDDIEAQAIRDHFADEEKKKLK